MTPGPAGGGVEPAVTLAVAQQYATAVAAGDDDALLALYAPGAEVWHNTDGTTQTPEQNARLGRWLRRKAVDLAFTEIRHTASADGFVQQHRMTGSVPGGRIDVQSCLVVTVDPAGRITRVEEYLDSAAMAPLRHSSPTER